jgi:hypothetical protein
MSGERVRQVGAAVGADHQQAEVGFRERLVRRRRLEPQRLAEVRINADLWKDLKKLKQILWSKSS